jgi:hypothetical protein
MSARGTQSVIATVQTTSYSDSTVAPAAYYAYRVRAVGAEGAKSPYSAADVASTTLFTDPSLFAQTTLVRAVHILELRDAIDAVRSLAGLSTWPWSEPIVAGVTVIRAAHLVELRGALAEALTKLGAPAASYSRSVVTGGLIRASDLQEIRSAIR